MSQPNDAKIIPFGKYKGQPIEVLAADESYRDWLLSQGWFTEKFRDVYNVVINYGGEPQDSPEHNALQARLLNDDFCLSILRAIEPKWFNLRESYLSGKARPAIFDVNKIIDEKLSKEEPITVHHVEFEHNGWDSVIRFSGGLFYEVLAESFNGKYNKETGRYEELIQARVGPQNTILLVECKPVVGDDYPSILRQMKNYKDVEYHHCIRVLLAGSVQSAVVDLATITTIFERSHIHLLTVDSLA